jgi:hypothetical protein
MISPPIAKRLMSGPLFPAQPPPDCAPNSIDFQPPELTGVTLPPNLATWRWPQIVGVYRGGAHHSCGVVHPAGSCMMRGQYTSAQFCAVCRYIMVDLIDPAKHAEMDRYHAPYYLT